jgi:hypothetical protein
MQKNIAWADAKSPMAPAFLIGTGKNDGSVGLFVAMARSEGIRVPLFPSVRNSGEHVHDPTMPPEVRATKTQTGALGGLYLSDGNAGFR